jgi:hypothetical protein
MERQFYGKTVLWKDISASRWMRICLVGLMVCIGSCVYRGLPDAGIPFTEDRRVGGHPGDGVGGALASGNVAAAGPATGVASAARPTKRNSEGVQFAKSEIEGVQFAKLVEITDRRA